MKLLLALFLGEAAGMHHNIRAEIAEINGKLGKLAEEASLLSKSKQHLLQVGNESLKKWEKAEHKSEKTALAALRRNDIAFDELEQQMEKRLHST